MSLSTAEPEREVAHAPAAPASARAAPWAAWLVLAAILAGGLALRLYNNGHGLPFVFHPDEADHFTNRALNMIAAGTLDPVYLQNPSGFTEVMYAVLRLGFGGNPYHVGRVVAALLALLGVAAVYGAGRRLWGRAEGLAAAAVLSFAFLPVAYSRYALTDVGTFVGVALAAYGIVRVREDGALRYYLLAGAASGLAIGFKYTAGVIVVPLVLAGFRDRRRLAAGLGATVVAFFITTPYFFIHLHGALYQLKVQNHAAGVAKVGQNTENPFVFYLASLTWALGWGPALAALVGIVVELRRDRPRGLLLIAMPALLLVYLSLGAGRWFARWLLPAYPILALFAGVGFVWLARRLFPRRPAAASAALAVLVAAALVQGVRADVHTGRVMGKTNTLTLMRDYLFAHAPPKTRIVIDPAIPEGFFDGRFTEGFGAPPKTLGNQWGTPTRYMRKLSPKRIEAYRAAGYCTVISLSHVRDRAFLTHLRKAMAYYDALPREGKVVFRASPYKRGAKPVPFDFDFSTVLYLPSAYERPGPDVTIYRLNRCTPGFGADAHTTT